MNRNRMQGSQGKWAGNSGQRMDGLAVDSFDFEVVPSRRHQQAGRSHRARREASDEVDRQRAVWDVTDL